MKIDFTPMYNAYLSVYSSQLAVSKIDLKKCKKRIDDKVQTVGKKLPENKGTFYDQYGEFRDFVERHSFDVLD